MQKLFIKRSTSNTIPTLLFGEPAIRTLDTGRIEFMMGDQSNNPQFVNRPQIPVPQISIVNTQRVLSVDTPIPTTTYQHEIKFLVKIPSLDKVFLEYSPFIELRMLKSTKKKKIVSPSNNGGCVLGFNNREQSGSIIPQTTQILIPPEFKVSQTDVNFMTFTFNAHLYFGNLGKSFSFPILKTDFDTNGSATRNRRQVGSGRAFNGQNFYQRTGAGITKVPNKGKRLVVGFRIACLQPGTKNRLIYGDDSMFFVIQPELCKQKDSSLDYYYKWNVINL